MLEPTNQSLENSPHSAAARGFGQTVRLSVPLRLDDPLRPADSGRWTLAVAGGQGTLTPGKTNGSQHPPPDEPVRLGPRGFAALYAGTPLATLRRAGLAVGGGLAEDDALDGAFAGPAAYMVDHF